MLQARGLFAIFIECQSNRNNRRRSRASVSNCEAVLRRGHCAASMTGIGHGSNGMQARKGRASSTCSNSLPASLILPTARIVASYCRPRRGVLRRSACRLAVAEPDELIAAT